MALPDPMHCQTLLHEESVREMTKVLFCDFFMQNQYSELKVLDFKVQRIRSSHFAGMDWGL